MIMIDLAKDGGVQSLSATICVIGSGPAGGLLAGELASTGHDVILLEAGANTADLDETETVAHKAISGEVDLRFGFSRQVGGSSNLWAGRVAPLESIDFEPRSWIADSGWPITRAALEDYYSRAAEIMGISWPFPEAKDISALAASTPELSGALTEGSLEVKRFLWTKEPFNVGSYLRRISSTCHARLTMVVNARVAALYERSLGCAVEAALVVTPNGRRVDVRAEYFVVAAGGLETPRLLLNSTSVRPSGIGNEHDVVGRYFSTHPKANMAVLRLKRPTPLNSALFGDHVIGESRVRYGLGFNTEAQTKQKALNHYVQLSPVFEYRANRLFEMLKGQSALASSFIDRSSIVRGLLPGFGLMAYEALNRLAGLQRSGKMFVMRAFLDQYPDRDHRVARSAQVDRFGCHKVDLIWGFAKRDQQSVLSFLKAFNAEIRRRGLGHVEYERLCSMSEWPLIGIHSHFLGTTRMGDDPKTAVIDSNCKVFGYENLFISGPSTFPTYGYANPFLTIVALAIRLADYLKSRIAGDARSHVVGASLMRECDG